MFIELTAAEQAKIRARQDLAAARDAFALQLRSAGNARGKKGRKARQALWDIGKHEVQEKLSSKR